MNYQDQLKENWKPNKLRHLPSHFSANFYNPQKSTLFCGLWSVGHGIQNLGLHKEGTEQEPSLGDLRPRTMPRSEGGRAVGHIPGDYIPGSSHKMGPEINEIHEKHMIEGQ